MFFSGLEGCRVSCLGYFYVSRVITYPLGIIVVNTRCKDEVIVMELTEACVNVSFPSVYVMHLGVDEVITVFVRCLLVVMYEEFKLNEVGEP